jgi:hypothetical protein
VIDSHKSHRPTYVLHLQPAQGVDGIRMLRAALKVLLRRFRLRCISISIEEKKDAEHDAM